MTAELDHDTVRQMMSDALDGLLEGPDRTMFERHIGKCSECARQFEILRKSVGIVRSLPRPQAPAELSRRLARRLRAGQRADDANRFA